MCYMYLTGWGLIFATLSKIIPIVNLPTKPSTSVRWRTSSTWCLKYGAPVVFGVPGKTSFCQPSAIGVSRSRLAHHLRRGSWSAPRGLRRWPEFHPLPPPRYSVVQSTLSTIISLGLCSSFYKHVLNVHQVHSFLCPCQSRGIKEIRVEGRFKEERRCTNPDLNSPFKTFSLSLLWYFIPQGGSRPGHETCGKVSENVVFTKSNVTFLPRSDRYILNLEAIQSGDATFAPTS